jgi:hypothetical protein
MQLRDLKRLYLERGSKPPPEKARYGMHCCGYTLLISDDQRARKTTEALRQYHGMLEGTPGSPEKTEDETGTDAETGTA